LTAASIIFILLTYSSINHGQIDGLSADGGLYTQRLDWFESVETSVDRESQQSLFKSLGADIIIGADIMYEPGLALPLVTTLKMGLTFKNDYQSPTALIALTLRRQSTFDLFLSVASKCFFIIKLLFTPPIKESRDTRIGSRGVIIYRIKGSKDCISR